MWGADFGHQNHYFQLIGVVFFSVELFYGYEYRDLNLGNRAKLSFFRAIQGEISYTVD